MEISTITLMMHPSFGDRYRFLSGEFGETLIDDGLQRRLESNTTGEGVLGFGFAALLEMNQAAVDIGFSQLWFSLIASSKSAFDPSISPLTRRAMPRLL